MKKDIKNREDIMIIVDAFYDKVKTDNKIGYLFTDVAQVNWELHLPIMYDFWENILFYTGNFNGNPMLKHKELNQKSKMSQEHFQRWNLVFNQTVDDLYEGEKANEIKHRAVNISETLMHKVIS
jgi:hemoglobin